MTEREKRVQWFQNARFGMFLHWGLYAIPGRGEWYMSNARIPAEQYERYMQEFTAKTDMLKKGLRSQRLGPPRKAGRNAVCRPDGQASRRLLPV